MTVTDLTRKQVLAFRVRAQQLDRPRGLDVSDLAVLDLGVQDAKGGSRLALDARLAAGSAVPDDPTAAGLDLAWSVRGAPHLHRRTDLATVRRAVWPVSDADAVSRLGDRGRGLGDGLAVWSSCAEAMRSVLTARMPKGEASRALSDTVDDSLSYRCRVCAAPHISDSLFRPAAFIAGSTLDWDTSPPVLRRLPGRWPGAPTAEIRPMIEAYLRLLGPAGPAEVAGYLGARAADVRERWPDDLAEVTIDGKRAWLLEDDVSTASRARMRAHVRLLNPYDPWLQARDRALIAPDKKVHQRLWPVLGRPGVLLVDGEVAGTWRAKAAAKRLDISIEPFGGLAKDRRADAEREARRVAALRARDDVRVSFG